MINIKGTDQNYELVTWNTFEEWDSHRLEVKLIDGQKWLVDFQSAYKAF
jgi:hypothetical protein